MTPIPAPQCGLHSLWPEPEPLSGGAAPSAMNECHRPQAAFATVDVVK